MKNFGQPLLLYKNSGAFNCTSRYERILLFPVNSTKAQCLTEQRVVRQRAVRIYHDPVSATDLLLTQSPQDHQGHTSGPSPTSTQVLTASIKQQPAARECQTVVEPKQGLLSWLHYPANCHGKQVKPRVVWQTSFRKSL